jgi:hypothetical protein
MEPNGGAPTQSDTPIYLRHVIGRLADQGAVAVYARKNDGAEFNNSHVELAAAPNPM